jgi:hypothetical protein
MTPGPTSASRRSFLRTCTSIFWGLATLPIASLAPATARSLPRSGSPRAADELIIVEGWVLKRSDVAGHG